MTTATDVTQLAPNQIREAGEVLARAFHDDPYWLWVLPGECKRAQVLPWFMETWMRCCRKCGQVHTTADSVAGVAAWMPPGKFQVSLVTMILAGMVFVPLKFGPAAFGRLMSSTNYVERLHKRDVPQRHWYLPTLGVDPPRQGQGVGSALIQTVLSRSDAEGLLCYLETETAGNVAFYQRHGFEVVVEDDLPRGGPHFWTMKREPQG